MKKTIVIILFLLCLWESNAKDTIDSTTMNSFITMESTFNKKIEILEIKASNYESLLSMQGAFYQSLIAVLIFVFGFSGWLIVNKKIENVKIDNDERVKSLRSVLIMTLGDINHILGNHAYESKDTYLSFTIILQGAKYLFESINLYSGKKSLMNFLDDNTKEKNILGLTGKLIIDLEIIENITTNHILKGEFDKEIADDYTEITMKLDDLKNCSNSLIAEKSKTIFDSIVKYVKDKQLLNT